MRRETVHGGTQWKKILKQLVGFEPDKIKYHVWDVCMYEMYRSTARKTKSGRVYLKLISVVINSVV